VGARYSPAGGNACLLKELAEDKEGTIRKYQLLAQEKMFQ
jgi:hypothetical protein